MTVNVSALVVFAVGWGFRDLETLTPGWLTILFLSEMFTATAMGSDHGPAESSAVTKNVVAPAVVTFVVISQKRPS